MKPSIGRIVHYTLSDQDAAAINKRRDDARKKLAAQQELGYQVHTGNPVKAGDVFPMIITRIWSDTPDESTGVQGQVFLDGCDNLWVTSVGQGDGERQWHEAPRV